MSSIPKVILDWKELSNFRQLDLVKNSGRGVYIWGFRFESEFVPYYVGIAENIYLRLCEHMAALISGKYTIYHRDYLKVFAEHKKNGEGQLFAPSWPENFTEFISNHEELLPHIKNMINRFEYSYSQVDQGNTLNVTLKDIEKYCISKIGKDNLANTRGGKFKSLNVTHFGCSEITRLFS